MRLVLVIPALTAGGAERVMTIMANHWAGQGWDIRLLTLDDGSVPPFFPLHEKVRHRPLALLRDSPNALNALLANVGRLRRLRQAIRAEAPEAVISFLDTTNVLTLLATPGLKVPVIVSEHIDPAQYPLKPVWNALRRRVYPLADRVTVLTPGAIGFFPASLRSKIRVIPNPVAAPVLQGEPDIPLPEGRTIVAMGRLVEQKGFDILLEAFAGLRERHPGWHLVILGEGPLRGELEQLRDRLDLRDRVRLPGKVKRPEAVLARADLFVLSSRYEGFPMALCEAMAAGLPVVSADCPSGPREIITDGRDGILVPPESPAPLAEAMGRLMADEAERRRLGSAASAITRRFGVDQVMAIWEETLRDARAGRGPSSRSG
jgi:GalNAc-alpha-(1->4)-GalNAc-alpha-(1->3)-diNAcBac-PP-undecaprenol alpha-1,4-N-acetyl-D-galactosaminyltransferase